MGARGPKPGWKKPAAKSSGSAVRPVSVSARKAPDTTEPLSAADRENPEKLSGEPLRKLAHNRGIARSELENLTDEKIREQLRYRVHRQYEESEA